jgi:hypothetical protein
LLLPLDDRVDAIHLRHVGTPLLHAQSPANAGQRHTRALRGSDLPSRTGMLRECGNYSVANIPAQISGARNGSDRFSPTVA